jgi:hypothetical protein
VVALLLRPLTPEGLLLMAVTGLAGANLVVGCLNLVPGLPLDGGRVLKALVWWVSGSPYRGSIVAGWVGRAAAALVIAWTVFQEPLTGSRPDVVDFVLAVVVALFLWSGATAAMASARARSRMPHLVARQLARRTLAVPGDLPLAEAVRRARDEQAGSIVTVTGSGVPDGIVSEAAVTATPEDRRPWVATSTVARSLDPGLRLSAELSGEDLVRAITGTPASEYLLVDAEGQVVGVLATSDVDRAYRQAAH